MQKYDAIVIGLGAMGSAAAYHLAKRNLKVLGLDMYEPTHKMGSSHGQSRIIREAYAEAPEYVPLVQRAYSLWYELEKETTTDLLTITGGLTIGKADGELLTGALTSARQHNISHSCLTTEELSAKFPAFQLPSGFGAVYEFRAGILKPEACIKAHLAVAANNGAKLIYNEPVVEWTADKSGSSITVKTTASSYHADRLVITTGPWAAELLRQLNLPLRVERMLNLFFEPLDPQLFSPANCPVYLMEVPEGIYYGFPLFGGQGIKFGNHTGGEVCTPHTINRTVAASEIEHLQNILNKYLPKAAGKLQDTLTCMYTNTPDSNFILDKHPYYPQVAFGCGFSGHGFKFANVIGEVLADLVMKGRSEQPIEFLGLARFY